MTSSAPAELFDHHALALHRRRAALEERDGSFLHKLAAAQVSERLIEVNRTFTDPVVIGPKAQLWAEKLAEILEIPAPATMEDTETLPLQPNAHDLVVHGLALHWSNDIVGQLVQARRALLPDGLFIGVLLAGRTLHELRAALATAETELEGGLSPRVAPMGEIRDLGGLLGRAGFALPVADADRLSVTYASPMHLMHDLRAMGETNALAARRRSGMRRRTLMRACEIYSANYTGSDGKIMATFELVFLTGWAPSDSQQRPLRPGSANTRLADALGVAEYSQTEGGWKDGKQ